MSLRTLLSRTNLILVGRLALFLGTIGILGWLSLIPVGRRLFVEPVTELSVAASHFLINLFGGEATQEGTRLIGPRMSLDVRDACNGVVAMILFIGAVVAHEARASMKQWVNAGDLVPLQDEFDGLDKAPQAFIDLLGGGNVGTRIVRVAR